MHQFSVMMFSFRLVPTLFYFSHIVKAAAAVPPALTDTPQLLQLPTLQQPNTTSFAKPKSVNLPLLPPPVPFRISHTDTRPKIPATPVPTSLLIGTSTEHLTTSD